MPRVSTLRVLLCPDPSQYEYVISISSPITTKNNDWKGCSLSKISISFMEKSCHKGWTNLIILHSSSNIGHLPFVRNFWTGWPGLPVANIGHQFYQTESCFCQNYPALQGRWVMGQSKSLPSAILTRYNIITNSLIWPVGCHKWKVPLVKGALSCYLAPTLECWNMSDEIMKLKKSLFIED